MDHSQTATPTTGFGSSVAFPILLALVTVSGCVQNSYEVLGTPPGITAKISAADEVLMAVDDVGVKWGSGKVGDALKAGLLKNGTFQQVHFPIYPSRPVANRLQVIARGGTETDAGSGFAKSVITGLLVFLPAGVLQYRDVFTITAEVTVFNENQRFGPVTLTSKVAADHTLFNGPETYALQAQRMALEDLANQLSASLAEHPEWFRDDRRP